MAEFHDIEYQGIGADQDIDVLSERCFRDHSPGDSVISLDHTDHAEFNASLPSFHSSKGPSRVWHAYSTILEQRLPVPAPEQAFMDELIEEQAPPMSAALSKKSIKRWKSMGGGVKPLERYKREKQAHEQLALGMRAPVKEKGRNDHYFQAPVSDQWPSISREDDKFSSCYPPYQNVEISTTPEHLPVTRHHGDWPRPGAPTALYIEPLRRNSADSSRFRGLNDMLNALHGEEWGNMTPEDQNKYAHHIAMTKRRLRGEESPREHRMPKMRKRAWSEEKKGG